MTSFKTVKQLLTMCLLQLFSSNLIAQSVTPQSASTNVWLNTGIDPSFTTTLPIGSASNWLCQVGTTGPMQITRVVPHNNSCLLWSPPAPNDLAAWIAPSPAICGPQETYYGCQNTVDFYYSITFNLNSPVFWVDWFVFAAGWLQDISVNGTLAYNAGASQSNHPWDFVSSRRFNHCKNFKKGSNIIVVHVIGQNSGASNCKHSGLKIHSWMPQPYSYPSISGPSVACIGDVMLHSVPDKTILAIPDPTAHNFVWTKPANFVGTPGNTHTLQTTVNPFSGGLITVTLHSIGATYTGTYESCASTAAFSVTVPPPLNITTTGTNLCQGSWAHLTASGAGTFTWYAPPGQTQISTMNNIFVNPSAPTTYTVKSITNPGNCPYSKTVTINVLPKPTLTVSSSPTVCYNNPITVWATQGLVSYTWLPTQVGPPTSQHQFTATIMPVSWFIVQATASNGCTNSALASVSVFPNPTVQVSSNPTLICSGQSTTLNATGANTYYWLPPNIWSQTVAVSPSVTTVYSAMGVNNFNCHSTTFYQQNVIGAPSVSVMPLQICSGVQNTLSAGGAVNYTVLVGNAPSQSTYTGSNNSPNNTFDVVLNLTAGTTYTVYGTGPNNLCIGNTTGNITMGNPIPLTVSNVTLCTNASNCAILTASSSLNAPINYTWGTIGPFGASALFCPLVNTNYTVSATSPSACANSATADIIVLSYCCSQPTTGLTVLNHTAGLGGSYSNTSYLLGSSVTLTSSTTFSHSEVWMLPGVKITVPSGMYFEMERSRFFACGINMWQGIEIQDGGWIKTLNGNLHSNLIEDAEIGIDLSNISVTNSSPLPPINLERVVFNKNFIGIRIANSDQALDSLAIGINGCVFTSRTFTYVSHPSPPPLDWPSANDNCLTTTVSAALRCALSPTAGLAPPFISNTTFPFSALKHPHSSHPGHIGIQIKTIGLQSPTTLINNLPAGVQFGITYTTTPGDFNLFDGLGVGIEVTDASFVTKNNVFQNMKEYGYVNSFGQYGGKGVMHVIQPSNLMNARLDLTGSSTSDGNRFYDCITGVFASHVYQNWIRFCLFRSKHDISTALNPWIHLGDTGVSICTNRLNQTIGYNEFNNLKHGLVLTTGTASCLYNVAGSGPTAGTFIYNLDIKYNYFGPLVNSTVGYGGGAANSPGSEYMSSAIELLTPNTSGWPPSSTAPIAGITANRLNRVFRGISVDGFGDTGFLITQNKIEVEDDLTFTTPPVPAWGYGISIKNNSGNLSVKNNSLEAVNIWNLYIPTPTISLIYLNNNFNNSTTYTASPIVECNTTRNAYIGYHFDGWNGDAIWEGNEMCNHHYGMALTNNGEIGTQGTATLGSSNRWVDNVFVNCDQWGNPNLSAPWQTYSENSNADNSFLWVIQDQLTIPEFNPVYNTGSGTSINYFVGTSSNINIAPINRLMDCIYDPFAPIPPTWRLVGAGQTNTPANSHMFRIYPNPTSSELTIESLETLDEVQVELYSIAGELMNVETKLKEHLIAFNLEHLPPTLYFVVVKSKGQTLYTSKVIKAQ